jgi:putative membrane protein
MRRLISLLIFLIVLITGAAFTKVNSDPVTLNYYFGSLTLPLSGLVLIALIMGVLLGALAVSLATLRLRYDNRRLKKQAKLAEQEIDSLRVLPLRDIP